MKLRLTGKTHFDDTVRGFYAEDAEKSSSESNAFSIDYFIRTRHWTAWRWTGSTWTKALDCHEQLLALVSDEEKAACTAASIRNQQKED